MRYIDKLITSAYAGTIITAIGTSLKSELLVGAGLGLAFSGFLAFGDDYNLRYDGFEELRKEFHKRERLLGKLIGKNKTESLRKIALECVSDIMIGSWGGESREYSLEAGEILRYARRYNVNPLELLDAIKKVDIVNRENEFEKNVVNPIKRAQGIYY
ncbi:MAG: hypothetical protein Q7S06_01090 [Nanoarchaeota archaeon]|nr:hypothetical protein [Nanoarchaeota archaeon]